MTGRMTGEVAVVTAAARGIGRAIALAFAAEGARVFVTDVDAAELAELSLAAPAIVTKSLDVTDALAVESCARQTGPVTVLVNCAGFVHCGSILDCEPDEWSRSFDLNVSSMYRTIRAWLPGMLEAGGGSIVNIASVASSIRGVPNRCAYGATKGAVIGLTKAVAADFVGQGIRCNAICPGTVDTPSLGDRMRATGNEVAARESFIARQPMGRLGTAGEIGKLAVYLACGEASFTTGAVHVIDGGWTM